MRSAYIDEAGIDNPALSPRTVVAGVVLHTDTLWHPLHARFESMRDSLLPNLSASQRYNFVFHAKDIWHGVDEWDRGVWKLEARMDVLRALCAVIGEYQLPIVWGHAVRQEVKEHYEGLGFPIQSKNLTEMTFTIAFWRCAIRAQKWMDANTSGECMNLVVENNKELQWHTKIAFKALRDPGFIHLRADKTEITKIVDAPSFMDKADAPPLQLADTCAFLLKRSFNGDRHATEILRPILASLTSAFSDDELVAEVGGRSSEAPSQ